MFVCNLYNNLHENKEERKKLRKIKNYLKKKSSEVFTDYRIVGIINIAFLTASPFILTYELKFENIFYLIFLIFLSIHFLKLVIKK